MELSGAGTTLRFGGEQIDLPIGVQALTDDPLAGADPPTPAMLTNALGLVTDHLADAVRLAPAIVEATTFVISGEPAIALAQVESGRSDLRGPHPLRRADAEDLFRTIVAETRAERIHNPGLDPADVDEIVATCCIVLAIIRRLDIDTGTIAVAADMAPTPERGCG
jgi:exopolyphosphatase/pppGpp-phosphohydrolase